MLYRVARDIKSCAKKMYRSMSKKYTNMLIYKISVVSIEVLHLI